MPTDRLAKRIKAARRKHGACCLCVHREVTESRYHCRNQEQRSHGACTMNNDQPQFAFDDSVLGDYDDGNR